MGVMSSDCCFRGPEPSDQTNRNSDIEKSQEDFLATPTPIAAVKTGASKSVQAAVSLQQMPLCDEIKMHKANQNIDRMKPQELPLISTPIEAVKANQECPEGISLSEILPIRIRAPPTLKTGRQLRIILCSWNVGNADPKTLQPWIPKGGNGADLIVVGMQESTYGHGADRKLSPMLEQVIGEKYYRVAKTKLMEMRIQLFALKALAKDVENVWTTSEATGLAGIVGNKGGLCIGLRIRDTPIVFVSAHLAAHRSAKYLKHRHQNVQEILKHLIMKRRPSNSDPAHHLMKEFAHAFWMGDLNYRVDPEHLVPPSHPDLTAVPTAIREAHNEEWYLKDESAWPPQKLLRLMDDWVQVDALVKRDQWAALLKGDQLNRSIANGEIFHNWIALQPEFPPTFKVFRHSGVVHQHQRVSAYCDRVLYISRPTLFEDIKEVKFESVPEMITSDHKPVRAELLLQLPSVKMCAASTCLVAQNGKAQWPVVRIWGCAVHKIKPMDCNGMSDPYLRFDTIPCVSVHCKSHTKKRTLDAEWSDLHEMELYVTCQTDLEHINLSISCLDKDLISEDDLIGHVTISVGSLLEATEHFSKGLSKYGSQDRGTLSFSAAVFWPDPENGKLYRCS